MWHSSQRLCLVWVFYTLLNLHQTELNHLYGTRFPILMLSHRKTLVFPPKMWYNCSREWLPLSINLLDCA